MKLIAAVDHTWGIGKDGDLLVSLPEDQRGTFKVYTYGGTVVYGRKTLATFPKGKLLPGRKNIVLSRNPDLQIEGAIVLRDTYEVIQYEKDHPEEKIWIIGGAEVYRTFLPYCDEAVITHIDHSFAADAFFPNLDELPEWIKIEESGTVHSEKGFDFTVAKYRQQSV